MSPVYYFKILSFYLILLSHNTLSKLICVTLENSTLDHKPGLIHEYKLKISATDITHAKSAAIEELSLARHKFLMHTGALGLSFLSVIFLFHFLHNRKQDYPADISTDRVQLALLREIREDKSFFKGYVRRCMQSFFGAPIIMFLGYLAGNIYPKKIMDLWPTYDKLLTKKINTLFKIFTKLLNFINFYKTEITQSCPELDIFLPELDIFLWANHRAFIDFIGTLSLANQQISKLLPEEISLLSHVTEEIKTSFNNLYCSKQSFTNININLCQFNSILNIYKKLRTVWEQTNLVVGD